MNEPARHFKSHNRLQEEGFDEGMIKVFVVIGVRVVVVSFREVLSGCDMRMSSYISDRYLINGQHYTVDLRLSIQYFLLSLQETDANIIISTPTISITDPLGIRTTVPRYSNVASAHRS